MRDARASTFRIGALVSAAWLGPALLAVFRAYIQGRLGNRSPATWQSMAWEGGDWLVYALLTPIAIALASRYPLTRSHLGRRIPVHVTASIVLCGAWAAGGLLLSFVLFGDATAATGVGFAGWFFGSLPFGFLVYFAVVGAWHAAFYFLEARERETQAARLSAQLAEARLGALRMQMQPHFLYNSLNAISVIVRDRDTTTALQMLEQLGEMLHRVTRSDRPSEVSLREELDFVRSYLAIEQVRFSDRLHPEFDAADDLLDAAVPEFVLQPLVENALKHGLARRTGSTLLRVEARREDSDLVLRVLDDGAGPVDDARNRPEGIGLANIRERLATLYGDRASLTLAATPEGGAVTTVRLPWRPIAGHRA